MDWAKALERNRIALVGIVAGLVAMLGGGGWVTPELRRAVLRVLRPAESAVRRLIVIAARGLALKPARARSGPVGAIPRGTAGHIRFQLFDPRKRFALLGHETGPRANPRIHIFSSDPRVAALWPAPQPVAEARPPDHDGQNLHRRLEALKVALADLPGQARRLGRWRAKRAAMVQPKFTEPLRPGRPPGHQAEPVHPIDHLLTECHGLAADALRRDPQVHPPP